MVPRRMAAVVLCMLWGLVSCSEADRDRPESRLVLVNGDQLHGRLVKIVDGELYFAPAMATEGVLTVGLDRVRMVTIDPDAEVPPQPAGETLTLRDGSRLSGAFGGITPDGLKFSIEGGEAVVFPLATLEVWMRDAASDIKPPATREQHTVITAKGDVLSGEIAQRADGQLSIKGGQLEATMPPESAAAICFARPEAPAARAADDARNMEVATRAGSRIIAYALTLEMGRLSVWMAGDVKAEMPVERVITIRVRPGGKKLLYLKKGSPDTWTAKGKPLSQHEEISRWQKAGYVVTTKDLAELKITPDLLAPYAVVRLNGSGQRRETRAVTHEEGKALRGYVQAGGRLFVDAPTPKMLPAVAPFGVSEIGAATLHGTPMTFGPVRLDGHAVKTVAAEELRTVSIKGDDLKAAAVVKGQTAVACGSVGGGKVLVVFAENWSHDATYPFQSYRANVFEKDNLEFLDACIDYISR